MTRRTNLAVVVFLFFVLAVGVHAATLKPESIAGWTAYVAATEQRVEHELADGRKFLGSDFDSHADEDRRVLAAGTLVIRKVETRDSNGRSIDVPHALIHDWRGAVFIAGVSLKTILATLESRALDVPRQDVLQAAVLARGPGTMKVFLRLRREKFVTAVYNTEHDVRFTRYGPLRASSVSTATKIAEVESPGTPRERELPQGEDRGFLWRWNAYWRYEQVDGGVIVECESISLSRDVPGLVRFAVGPLIDGTARESMTRTLLALRDYFQRR